MPGNRHIPRYHSQNNHGKSHESPSGVKFESMELPSQRAAQPSSVSKVDPPKPNMNEKQHPEGDGDSKNVLPGEKRFTQRSRLFVGNLPLDMSEEDFRKLFLKFGEISEIFVNSSKGFGFVRLDTRANAEKAKWELDGYTIKNRQLRIRFASHGAALSIKNLSPFVSNELLESAFSQFGNVERAVVIVDDRGRSTGRGIIEFARKASATKALQQISDGCFLLTSSPQAVVVKPLEQEDTEDGLGEKNIPRNQQYFQEREAPPRFAQPGNFEYEFALRWKALDEMERQLKEQSEKTIAAAREKLELEMESAIHDHKTMMMKQDLMRRQEELRRLEEARQRELERRGQLEMAREDAHNKELQVLANRQEVLRAQVEGNYKQPMSREEQAFNRNQGQRSGGFGGNVNNPMMQEALAHEMLGSGQGGLGPAPVKHSEKHCPNTKSNMKKLIGNSGLIRKEIRFYDLAFTGLKESACGSRNVGNPLQQQSSTSYKKLSLCPHMLSCQTFSEWKFQTSINRINRMFAARSIKSPPLTIYFIPVGPFPPFIYEYRSRSGLMLFDLICKFLSRYFTGCEVRTLPECEIQDKCVKNRIHCVTKKQQYYVADVLKFLQKKLPKDGYAIVGLSWHDLYPCETLNFVLGQGSSQYSTCVSSFGRFDPTYVKGFKGNKDGIAAEDMEDITEINDSLLWKLFKIISHETCHVFSIMHCSVFECLMNSSSSSKEALSQPLTLCPLCMSKLNYLLSTYRRSPNPAPPTIRKYFSSLLEFFQSVFGNTEDVQLSGVRNCMEWLKEMIVYLL